MTERRLDDYREIVGSAVIGELREIAARLAGRRIKMINSTAIGGGVAEILSRLVPLMNELGIEAHWEVIKGGEAFFHVTKQFHHALQGGRFEHLGPREFAAWLETNRTNAAELVGDEDFMVIHDPQPLGLVEARGRAPSSYWIWRCHIDLSQPDARLWEFLRPYVEKYDATVFSSPEFRQELPIPQHIFYPSIDPLSQKNRELPQATVERLVAKLGVPRDKPIVIQVSRFDRLKDPLGVMRAFRLARRRVDCRLVLVGGSADDDPEGAAVLAEVLKEANGEADIHVLGERQYEEIEINALVRAAAVVVQKSIKEGFGLTVTEALWKRKPVIATPAGGISAQVIPRGGCRADLPAARGSATDAHAGRQRARAGQARVPDYEQSAPLAGRHGRCGTGARETGCREAELRLSMRIAQVAPLALPVPPGRYGGTERVIYDLCEALVARGHEVTLFASGDSQTSARLVPAVPRALWKEKGPQDPLAPLFRMHEELFRRAGEFDLIHTTLRSRTPAIPRSRS
jgi:trehalose synthase